MTKIHNIVHDQEVSGEPKLFNNVEFPVNNRPRAGRRSTTSTLPIAMSTTAFHHVTQPRHLGVPLRHGKMRQVRRHEVQRKRAFVSDGHRRFYCGRQLLTVPGQFSHFRARA